MTRQASRVVRGQKLLAEDWNDIIRRLLRLEDRFRSLQGKVNPAQLHAFLYVASFGDAIEALSVNYDTGAPGVKTYLAKPWTMRPTVTTRGGHVYAYTTDYERTDTFGGNVETQVLTPGYEDGDLIFAMIATRTTGVVVNFPGPDPPPGNTYLKWQVINVDGHQWAQKYVAP
jgi:hypothetical protein